MSTSMKHGCNTIMDKMIEDYYILNQIIRLIDTGVLIFFDHKLVQINNETRRIAHRSYRDIEANVIKYVVPRFRIKVLRTYLEVLNGEINNKDLNISIILPDGTISKVRCRYTKIKVKNRCGVFVSLHPMCNQPATIKSNLNAETPDFSGKSVIVTDDSEINLILAKKILEKTGIEIFQAKNGRECIEIFKKHPSVSVILMDMHMTIMDGYEASKIILEMDSNVPILALTATCDDEELSKIKTIGCRALIAKPINKKLLFDTISKEMR